MFALIAVLGALTAGAPASAEVIRSPDALRQLAKARAAAPNASVASVRFQLDLPLADDEKADLEDLQNPAGWRVSGQTFLINFDLGAVTPENFDAFRQDDLFNAPPQRVLYFWTHGIRSQSPRLVPGVRDGEIRGGVGWYERVESYGLAVSASADAQGVSGGDLPDGVTVPFTMQLARPQGSPSAFAGQLRIRVEGELRTLRGRSVLCGGPRNGAGYAVDEITGKTPYTIEVRQCLLPAVIDRLSLVKLGRDTPLKVWVRGERPPTPENEQTKVMTKLVPSTLNAPGTTVPYGATPSYTEPLPKRGGGG